MLENNQFFISPLYIFLYPTQFIPENCLVAYPADALYVENERQTAENIVKDKVFLIQPNTPILLIMKSIKPEIPITDKGSYQDSVCVLAGDKVGWIWMPGKLVDRTNYIHRMRVE